MLRRMCRGVANARVSRTLIGSLIAALAVGCGGQADLPLSRRDNEQPPPVVPLRPEILPDTGTDPERPPLDDGPDPIPFEEPGCPPRDEEPIMMDCDPFAATAQCEEGMSCFPFVSYPSGPCEVERFGAMCLPAGSGTQGDSCSRERCAADHICVSTGRGTQCALLCALTSGSANVCAPGLLCMPIDIEGFGGCL
jgi:hypothetical protein